MYFYKTIQIESLLRIGSCENLSIPCKGLIQSEIFKCGCLLDYIIQLITVTKQGLKIVVMFVYGRRLIYPHLVHEYFIHLHYVELIRVDL